nr:PREDICTED: uncharacterized protein LOC105662694 [Megachile rotundata]
MVTRTPFVFGFCLILLINFEGLDSARYIGRTPNAASAILDNSQNKKCDGCNAPGHPRGHASYPAARGPLDSVENYSNSTNSQKSGFLSRGDQNAVANQALMNQKSQHAISELNKGKNSEAVTLSVKDFGGFKLPKMKEYNKGHPSKNEYDIKEVVVVLRHQAGKKKDKNADVFVQTIYPKK